MAPAAVQFRWPSPFMITAVSVHNHVAVDTETNRTACGRQSCPRFGPHMPEARTTPVDPFDSEFRQRAANQGSAPIPPAPPQRDRERTQAVRYRSGEGDGGEGGGEGSGMATALQLTSFHAYVNSRPGVDWNTCGQAAIASIADYHGLMGPRSTPSSTAGSDRMSSLPGGRQVDESGMP